MSAKKIVFVRQYARNEYDLFKTAVWILDKLGFRSVISLSGDTEPTRALVNLYAESRSMRYIVRHAQLGDNEERWAVWDESLKPPRIRSLFWTEAAAQHAADQWNRESQA